MKQPRLMSDQELEQVRTDFVTFLATLLDSNGNIRDGDFSAYRLHTQLTSEIEDELQVRRGLRLLAHKDCEV